MIRRLTACLLPAVALLLASCYSVTPARFNRGFITSGHCLEQVTDADGKLEQFEVKDTPMERLFTLYASPDASSVMFLAFFFHQDSERSGCGTGTADVVNRAAFLALDEPPARARPHALALKLATPAEIETIRKYALAVNDNLKAFWKECGVTLVDFKLEFGRLSDGTIVLADEISPDTSRLWDSKTGEKLDKDRFRRDMGGVEDAYIEVMKRLEAHI